MTDFDHRNPPMMVCGHAANAVGTRADGAESGPSCAICDCFDVAPDAPLEGRFAVCSYRTMRNSQPHPLDKIVPSSQSLAFFRSRPDEECDEYYCGCWGWD